MKDLNYFPLDVESNIYGMTTLEFDDRTTKVLVATLECKIYCINYKNFKPHTREVEFTYIPNGAKIISISALKRSPNDYVIGITHSLAPNAQKTSSRQQATTNPRETSDYGRSTTYYLNIYASGSISQKFDLDYVAQGCQTRRLKYVPYHLFQTEYLSVPEKDNSVVKGRPFWLLSGGDNAIHAFCEDRPHQSFNEVAINEYFPEISNLPGLALWIDALNIAHNSKHIERAIALGFEDGSVRFYQSTYDCTHSCYNLIRESSYDAYTTIIPCVRLFRTRSYKPCPLLDKLKSSGKVTQSNGQLEVINLLALSSTNSSLYFEDVMNNGLDRYRELPESRRLDCSVAVAIDDLNMDGFNEIFIGTHGRELLTYKYDSGRGDYHLTDVKELNHPLFAISILDLTGDCLKDIVLLVSQGVIVMQVAVQPVIEACHSRVDRLLSLLG